MKRGLRKVISLSCAISMLLTCVPLHAVSDGDTGFEQEDILLPELTETADPVPAEEDLPPAAEPDGEPEEAAAPEAPADETDKETTQETVPGASAETDPAAPAEPVQEIPAETTPDTPAAEPAAEPEQAGEEQEPPQDASGTPGEEGTQEPGNEEPPAQESGDEEPAAQETEPDDPDRIPADRVIDLSGDPEQNDREITGTLAEGKAFVIRILSGAETDLFFVLEGSAALDAELTDEEYGQKKTFVKVNEDADADAEGSEEAEAVPDRTRSVLTGIHFEQDSSRLVHITGAAGTTFSLRVLTPAGWAALQAAENEPAEGDETEPADGEGTAAEDEPGEGLQDDPAQADPDPDEPAEEEPAGDEPVQEEVPAFEITEDTLVRYNGGDETVTVPDGIREIGSHAFEGNETLRTVILPDSVEIINNSAFADCVNLETVEISEQSGLTTIGHLAFRNDVKLDLSFAANVPNIMETAFEGAGVSAGEEETGEDPEAGGEENEEDSGEDEEDEDGEEPDGDAEDGEEEDEEEEEPLPQESPLVFEGEDYTVTVAFGEDAGFLQGTELNVREILPGTEEYRLYSGQTEEVLNENWDAVAEFARYFDITFIYNEEEIEPLAPIDVQVTFAEAIPVAEDSSLQAIHFAEEGAQVIRTDTDSVEAAAEDDSAVDTVAFSSDSFSVYGFVQTAKITEQVIAADGSAYRIEVTYEQDSGIPLNAGLAAAEILPEDERYEALLQEALAAAGRESAAYARFFDIEIRNNGEKIEPQASVSVRISLDDAPETDTEEMQVVHFAEEKTVLMDAETSDAADLRFDTDSFSVYGVIAAPSNPTVEDLDGMTFKLHSGSYYVTSTLNSQKRFTGTTNEGSAAVWQFESSGEEGKYYIVTADSSGAKKYVNLASHGDWGDMSLTDEPQAFDITKKANGKFTIGVQTPNGKYFYLKPVGSNGNIFCGRQEDSDNEFNLIFTQPQVSGGEQYVLVTKVDGQYYVILNDGTLIPTDSPEAITNQIGVSSPMVWQYRNDTLYHNGKEAGFNGSNTTSDFFHRYLDPDASKGYTDENYDNTTGHFGSSATEYYVDSHLVDQGKMKIDYSGHHISSRTNPGNYLGIEYGPDGPKIVGQQTADNAAEIYFVKLDNIGTDEQRNHVVNHIDISVESRAAIRVPLAYGEYYYKDETGTIRTLVVNRENPVTITVQQDVDIDRDDIKRATIDTYTIDSNGTQVPIDNTYYITGYSGNTENDTSSNQVRIEGLFKVANVGWVWNVDDNVKRQRLANKIYYTVTTTKNIEVPFIYNGFQLYGSEADAAAGNTENGVSGNAIVKLSSSFNYWDPANECPPVAWSRDDWRSGGIPGGSGMDFALGGTNEDENSVLAVEITKYIVDEAGNAVIPEENINTLFHIYRSSSASYRDVVGMDVDEYAGGQETYNYDNKQYFPVHDKTVTVGENGLGIVYDYDVPAGMIYLTEDTSEENLPRMITDVNGQLWSYKSTYIETEYVWRDDGIEYRRHVSKEYTSPDEIYRSIPEVLGEYEDINGIDWYNGFLEFYFYNVYTLEPIDVSVRKNWMHENGTVAEAPEHARVTVTLGRYKLVEDPDHPISGDLVINHSVLFKPGETSDSSHYNVSYTVKQGNRIVRSGTFSPANTSGTVENTLVMEDLPAGTYTLELAEGINGYTAATRMDGAAVSSKQITITAGQSTTVNVSTELTPVPKIRLVSLRVTNRLEGNNVYQSGNFTFPAGRTVIFTIYRPSQAFQGSGFWARVNGQDFPWPGGNPNVWTYVDQKWEYTIPENSNGETLNFIHNWGQENFVIKSVVLKSESDGSRGLESNSASGTDGAKPRLSAAKAPTRAATVLTGNPPVSDQPGMMYVADDEWPSAEEGDINRVVLGGGLWSDVVRDLPPADSQGHKYLYYIAGVEEQNVPEGTRVEILSDSKGFVLTSTGETVLQVTNTVPDEPPKITLRKTDENGIPLTGASFDITKPDGTTERITINAPDGIYRTEELAEGPYLISEVSTPNGYEPYSGSIAFTVDGKNVTAAGDLPEGVTYDPETLTFHIANQPISNGKLRLVKRWLDIFGNAAEAPSTPVNLKIVQMVQNQQPTRIVRVEFYYKGDGNGGNNKPNNYETLWTQVAVKRATGRGIATVLFRWNDWTDLSADTIRIEGSSTAFVEMLGSRRVRLNIPDDGNGISTIKVYVDNGNWNPWGNGGTRIDTGGYINDLTWPEENDAAEGYTATGGTKTVTLRSDMQWISEIEFAGNGLLSNNSARLPATYQNRACRYIIMEEPVLTGYSVSYSNNNLEGLGAGSEGTITTYNRENTTDITVVKVDKENHHEKLQGAVFEVRKLNASTAGVSYLSGWGTQTVRTDSEGKATVSDLGPGYYEFREVTAPAGYVIPEEGKDRFYVSVFSEGVSGIVRDDAKYPARWSVRRNDSMLVNNQDGSFTVGNEAGHMDIHVLKVDAADMTTPLTGAKFVLKQYDAEYKTLVKTWDEQAVSEEAGAEGTLTFEGLQTGYYELTETECPAGYIPPGGGPIRFKVEAGGERAQVEFDYPTGLVRWDGDTRTFKVGNKIGVKLPNTGGPGTALYTIPGLMLMLLAGGMLVRRKRKTLKGYGQS